MEKTTKFATVKSIVSGNNRQAMIKDSDLTLEVGDVVLIGRTNDDLFGSFDVGRVEKIQSADYVEESNVIVKDVITNSSNAFKGLKQDLRKKVIKEEIAKRMKQVDERQRMEMYAATDDNIAALMKELDNLQN